MSSTTTSEKAGSAAPRTGFKAYSDYKPSGLDWLAEIPESWSAPRLGFVTEVNPPKGAIRHEPEDYPVSFVAMEAIGEHGGLDLDSDKPLADVVDGYTYFEMGDVLVAKITPCFENGKGALPRNLTSGVGFGTTELHILRPGDDIDERFLFYLTISDHFRKLGEASMYGAAGQKRVPEEFVFGFRHPLPSLPEQRGIANFLDQSTSHIDRLIDKKERLIELLEEGRTALITKAVTKGLDPDVSMKDSGVEWLGEIPESWEISLLDKLIEPERPITYGIVQPGEYDPNGIFMVRGQNYSDGWDSPEEIFRVEPEIEKSYLRARLEPGDVLMTIVGAGTGNIAIVPDWLKGANLTQTTARLAFNSDFCSSRYFAYLLESAVGKVNVELAKKGAAQPGLNLNHIAKFRVLRPPRSQQKEIADYLDTKTRKQKQLIGKVKTAISRLKEYRSALITAAVTGKINVRDHVA